jgi:hypothetical protein
MNIAKPFRKGVVSVEAGTTKAQPHEKALT